MDTLIRYLVISAIAIGVTYYFRRPPEFQLITLESAMEYIARRKFWIGFTWGAWAALAFFRMIADTMHR
jgi:hypothetical protein